MIIVGILVISILGVVSAADQTISTSTSGGLASAINRVGTGETVHMENGQCKITGVKSANLLFFAMF